MPCTAAAVILDSLNRKRRLTVDAEIRDFIFGRPAVRPRKVQRKSKKENSLQRYELRDKLGEGTYGSVHSAVDLLEDTSKSSRSLVALKKMRINLKEEGAPQIFAREVSLLRQISHENVIGLRHVFLAFDGDGRDRNACRKIDQTNRARTYPLESHSQEEPNGLASDVDQDTTSTQEESLDEDDGVAAPNRATIEDGMTVCLVFDYCDCDLKSFIKRHQPFRSLPMLVFTFFQIVRGLEYLHALRIMHRDLKPQNLLIDLQSGCVKIADFGLAKSFLKISDIEFYTHEIVTLWYRAPEVILSAPHYDFGVDSWSLATTLFEMITGSVLFPGDSEIDTIFRIFRLMGTPNWPSIGADLPLFRKKYPNWKEAGAMRRIELSCPGVPAVFHRFLFDLLQVNPRNRLQVGGLFEDPFFSVLRDLLCISKKGTEPSSPILSGRSSCYPFCYPGFPFGKPMDPETHAWMESWVVDASDNIFKQRSSIGGAGGISEDLRSLCTNNSQTSQFSLFKASVFQGENDDAYPR